ncbi:hypothetical protein DPEC_G00324780 [Dallia pectoralis]|uniref:Uncharacterized protein n=1 Tax=Dallia pectoralis TaxID=75939 RepID=A0ACC2FB00_DALPE|nr:hypothetical protein DPEC_G00324780 [Dallia pectoralis]
MAVIRVVAQNSSPSVWSLWVGIPHPTKEINLAGENSLKCHEHMIAALGVAMNQVLAVQRLEKRLPEPTAAATVPLPESPPSVAQVVKLQLPRP